MKVSEMAMDPSGPEFRRALCARQKQLKEFLAGKTPEELFDLIGPSPCALDAWERRILRSACTVATLDPDSPEGRRDLRFLRRKAFEYLCLVASLVAYRAYDEGEDYGAAHLAAYDRFR